MVFTRERVCVYTYIFMYFGSVGTHSVVADVEWFREMSRACSSARPRENFTHYSRAAKTVAYLNTRVDTKLSSSLIQKIKPFILSLSSEILREIKLILFAFIVYFVDCYWSKYGFQWINYLIKTVCYLCHSRGDNIYLSKAPCSSLL